MQLSKRLMAVAENVTRGNRVADIGCDHAYISVYLVKNGISPNAIAMDINKGPLARAYENIKKYGVSKKIETRLSDGARQLSLNEADTIIIAGMGGALTVKILSESIETVSSVNELILQPQSEIFLVRKYIHSIGFAIEKEEMLIDEEKEYVIIKAHKGIECYDREVFYRYGKCLLESRNQVLESFLEKAYNVNEKIIRQLSDNVSEKMDNRKKELKEEQSIIKEGLKYYEM